ncbi:MAG: hypothetical protein LV480_13770 [Methylacidiphilales bacterium]|nr:hypothetical protein [Candidatus Methylacidiphilales bacterium]
MSIGRCVQAFRFHFFDDYIFNGIAKGSGRVKGWAGMFLFAVKKVLGNEYGEERDYDYDARENEEHQDESIPYMFFREL